MARHPRAEAAEHLPPGTHALVLEPSPPAVLDGEWFADDPVALVPEVDRPLVSPLDIHAGAAGCRTWHEVAAGDDRLARWARERWLGPWAPLPALPASYPTTRAALHQVAVYVISPARRAANGKMGLRYTRGGFGTPFFRHTPDGPDTQVRVEHGHLVVQRDNEMLLSTITTLDAAAELVGVAVDADAAERFDVPPPDGGRLDVDSDAARVVGEWFGFCASVLEELRAEATEAADDPSRVQLWPEHFDMAFDAGDAEAGTRANVGGSPGDAFSAEPYLYLGPWDRDDLDGDFWNASFGAVLTYGELRAAADQRAAALDFVRRGRSQLATRAR